MSARLCSCRLCSWCTMQATGIFPPCLLPPCFLSFIQRQHEYLGREWVHFRQPPNNHKGQREIAATIYVTWKSELKYSTKRGVWEYFGPLYINQNQKEIAFKENGHFCKIWRKHVFCSRKESHCLASKIENIYNHSSGSS